MRIWFDRAFGLQGFQTLEPTWKRYHIASKAVTAWSRLHHPNSTRGINVCTALSSFVQKHEALLLLKMLHLSPL